MIPDWLQPRLGEPFPPALVEWAATQPSLDAAIGACNRADWVFWLRANNAISIEEQRRVIRWTLLCASTSGLIRERAQPWWRGLLWPAYGALELARYWASPPRDVGDVASEFWLADLYNALLVLAGAGIAVDVALLYRHGWQRSRGDMVVYMVVVALLPAVRRGWRLLRRAVNRRRMDAATFASSWERVRPLLDMMWERADAADQRIMMRFCRE